MSNILHVNGQNNPQGASVTRFYGCWTGYGEVNATEAFVASDAQTSGDISTLFAYASAHSGTNAVLQVRVGAASPGNLVVTIATAPGQFEDATGSDSVDATEEFCYQLVTGDAGTTLEGISHVFVPDSGSVAYLASNGSVAPSGTADQFMSFSQIGTGTVEANVQQTFGVAGTLQKGFVHVSQNSRSDATAYTTRKNATTNGTISIAVAATTGTGDLEDASNTDAVADGDEWNWTWDQGGGSGTLTLRIAKIEFAATDAFPFLGANITPSTQASALTRYLYPAGGFGGQFDDTEADKQVKTNTALTWSDLYGYVSANSIDVTGTYTVRSRVSGTNGNLTMAWASAVTGAASDMSNTDAVADEDELDYSSVTTGITGSVTLRTLSTVATTAAASTAANPTLSLLGVGA